MTINRILTVNCGSSSVKFAVFDAETLHRRLSGNVERIGSANATLRVSGPDGKSGRWSVSAADASSGVGEVMTFLDRVGELAAVSLVSHRVVHGGDRFRGPVPVSADVLTELSKLAPLAPLHELHNLAGIQCAAERLSDVPQIACFDTAFHTTMPVVERMYGLPRRFYDAGVKRYGFHGLAYESVIESLRETDPVAAAGRVIACHLGNGASLCAIRQGFSVATTMGFTPLDGLLMGTRTGSLDPGIILYLEQHYGLSANQVYDLLAKESGLLGVSGLSSDMRDLLESPAPEAVEAVSLYCHRIVREIGALAAVLGGLDAITFSGGVGENAATVRARVCDQLTWLGVTLDPDANREGSALLHATGGGVRVFRVAADEERVLARHALTAQVGSPKSRRT